MPGKFRKCKICRTRCEVSEGIVNGLDFVCGVEHLAELGLLRAKKQQKAADRTLARKLREERRAHREKVRQEKLALQERRENALTLQEWIDRAQRKINRLVVLEDGPKGCISCATGEVTDCGHYYHRGSKYRTSWLTLSRPNLNGQCRHCNSFTGGGNADAYRQGYIERYGVAAFEHLEELKRRTDRGEIARPTIDEVRAFIKDIDKKLVQLQGRTV